MVCEWVIKLNILVEGWERTMHLVLCHNISITIFRPLDFSIICCVFVCHICWVMGHATVTFVIVTAIFSIWSTLITEEVEKVPGSLDSSNDGGVGCGTSADWTPQISTVSCVWVHIFIKSLFHESYSAYNNVLSTMLYKTGKRATKKSEHTPCYQIR